MPTGALDDEPALTARLAQAAHGLADASDGPSAMRALGFIGDLPALAPVPPVAPLALGGAPVELWAWRAGVKPVAFLTVDLEREAAVRRAVPEAVVLRRERRVEVGRQDHWRDDPSRGRPQVELYLAHERALAERCAALQAADPTRHAVELGQLLGYPRCCVDAFLGQRDRSNNSLNRYLAAARTRSGDGPWPWQLNDLAGRLVPFYPCHYRCGAAVAWVDAAVAALARVEPAAAADLARALTAAVVYVDHDHQVWLRGAAVEGAGVCYRAVEGAGAGAAAAALAAVFAAGDHGEVAPARVAIRRGGAPVATLSRVEPRLGFLARFG
ncbi:MAG: hypothetical protein R3B06_05715 [Kofleriaceae bacterium]